MDSERDTPQKQHCTYFVQCCFFGVSLSESKIEKRIAKKGYVLGTFLDIEGAFDNVSFEAIYKALQKTDIDSTTINWIFNMVVNRQTTVQLKNITKTIKIGKGCPQGGIVTLPLESGCR